ncbi:MAG: DUF2326 domain-containing protein [Patescibacteria group bacterium]
MNFFKKMLISKIYSNKKEMKPILFRTGFNIILGDAEISDETEHEHNVGKTSLAHLINFLLLKRTTNADPLLSHADDFGEGWFFFLELKLNDGNFLTIKRGFDEPSKVSMKRHTEGNQDFSELSIWDVQNVGLYVKKEADALTQFENLIGFDVLQAYSVRNFLTYTLRTQEDYGDVFQPPAFAKSKDVDWKPQLFHLFGFDETDVANSYVLQSEIELQKKAKDLLVRKNKSINNDAYALAAAIAEKEREMGRLAEYVEKFDFYVKEKGLNRELVEEVESQISRLNSERYRVDFEIARLKDALKDEVYIDLEDVEKLFAEAQVYFPESLAHSYNELQKFNEGILKERSKFLKKDLEDYFEYGDGLTEQLKNLNAKKEEMLKFLRSTDTFAKYKKYQSDLTTLDLQIKDFKFRLEALDTVEKHEAKIAELQEDVKKLAKNIKKTIDAGSPTFDYIKALFADIFKNTLEKTALLIVQPNKRGNPMFRITTLEDVASGKISGEAEGYTAKKVQCAALTLSILSAYRDKSFYRFAFFDGLFESWGDNPKINFIESARVICERNGLQLIVTMIKSDAPREYEIYESYVVATLDNDHRLFGIQF